MIDSINDITKLGKTEIDMLAKNEKKKSVSKPSPKKRKMENFSFSKNSSHVWWKHEVLYQIYPRSFYDANGDGIGDIPGLIEKLDYLRDLGIGGVWLSPVNESPMFDFGYDISDYRKIDPLFGTNKDFYRLIKEAHKRNIKIVMDLVLNHTSHLHPWFQESRKSKDNEKSDWYIWHDGKNGKPPNNWLAAFGGRAWTWDETRGQYYLHSHLVEQPDLNWRNPDLRKAVYGDIRFWLDKGVDGFRLDVINFLTKDDQFKNNPFTFGPTPRPYDMQKHIYDRNQPENHEIIRELRELINNYKDRMLVGEVYAAIPDPELSAKYLGNGKNELHLAFDFSIIYKKKWHATIFLDYVKTMYSLLPSEGWPVLTLSNHDQPRSRSRFGGGKNSEKRTKVAAAFLLTIKGTPFLYYGEEIGMENGKIKKSELQDPVGIKYWPFHPGRDPERTPMLWSGEVYAGFSKNKPWLPLNKGWNQNNLEKQKKNSDSIFNLHRELIKIRNHYEALRYGEVEFCSDGKKNLLCFFRKTKKETILVYLNFSKKSIRHSLPLGQWQILFSNSDKKGMIQGNQEWEGYEIFIAKQ